MSATNGLVGRPRKWANDAERRRQFILRREEERARMKTIVRELEATDELIQKAAAQGDQEALRLKGETPDETLHNWHIYWQAKVQQKAVRSK